MAETHGGIALFHFAQPVWLWLLPAVLFLAWRWWRQWLRLARARDETLGDYADAALLPYLLVDEAIARPEQQRRWLEWAFAMLMLALALAMLAMAGPRWRYGARPTAVPDAAVIIAVDLSRSMMAQDIAPSRLVRARQEVGDLLAQFGQKGIQAGLVVFAADAHLLTPITGDMEAASQFSRSLTTDMVSLQGSDPAEALKLSQRQLGYYSQRRGARNLHALLITDGDAPQTIRNAIAMAQKLAEGGPTPPIALHVMQIGTAKGAPIPDGEGYFMQDAAGKVHISQTDEAGLAALATAGNGLRVTATYDRADTAKLVETITAGQRLIMNDKSLRQWREEYHWLLGAAMLLLLGAWACARHGRGETL